MLIYSNDRYMVWNNLFKLFIFLTTYFSPSVKAEIQESWKITQATAIKINSVKEGLSVGFSEGEDLLLLSSSTTMSLSVKCFVHHMLQDNVKFIKAKLWFSSPSVIILHGLHKDVITLFMLDHDIAILRHI